MIINLGFLILKNMKDNLIQHKSFEFAIQSISLYKRLIESNEYVLSKQFFKSATSIGANVEEALGGYSRKDFVAKLGISLKESRETLYWLKLIEAGQFIDYDFALLKEECERLIKILTSIIKTTKSKM